jgi:molybdopterin molybdotransferase
MKPESYARVSDVLESVLTATAPIEDCERILSKAALGRVAAEAIKSDSDLPKFATSHMDGFALIASDLEKLGTRTSQWLKVVPGAGPVSTPPKRLAHGEAMRVATGGRIPGGADTVVPLEDAAEKAGAIQLKSKPKRGTFVYPAGADFRAGQQLIRQGQEVRAQDIALLLTIGRDRIKVRRRPVVTVLATGSELSDLHRLPRGKVRNTHGPAFVSMVRAAGCIPLQPAVCPDEEAELSKRIREALGRSDVLLTLGGTSVGRMDLVGKVVSGFDPEVFFHGIRMDRGRVAGAAVVGGKPLFMLPGPIQGAMNAFVLLALPALDKLRGGSRSMTTVKAKLSGNWAARERFKDFVKVVYVRVAGGDGLTAEPFSGDTESISLLTESNGFVFVPEEVTSLSVGTLVDVNLVPGFSSLS